MTKTEFTDYLAGKCGMTVPYAARILNAFLDSVEDALFRDGRLVLRGFGVFEVRETAARQARNPATGEVVDVPAGRTVRFRAAAAVRDYLE